MKAVIIQNKASNQIWTEVVPVDDRAKWIDAARAALDLSVARGRLKSANQPDLDVRVRVATQPEIAARIEELKLARALRFSGY
jgi:hypothetical protein